MLDCAEQTRARAVDLARGWIGTPYRHQASLRGVGADCLGLVRGVYAELVGQPAEDPPPYTQDWAEALRAETLAEGARRHLIEIALEDALPGDVILFRVRPGDAPAKHCGILSAGRVSDGRMIHAFAGRAVVETAVMRRPAFAFRFPCGEVS